MPFELPEAKFAQVEQIAEKATGGARDDDHVRFGCPCSRTARLGA